jgi:hypothetical protein
MAAAKDLFDNILYNNKLFYPHYVLNFLSRQMQLHPGPGAASRRRPDRGGTLGRFYFFAKVIGFETGFVPFVPVCTISPMPLILAGGPAAGLLAAATPGLRQKPAAAYRAGTFSRFCFRHRVSSRFLYRTRYLGKCLQGEKFVWMRGG